jgi:hypothetical protein
MFSTEQVKQFKEAFNMIDQDGDGRVTEEDLKVMLSNLGKSFIGTARMAARAECLFRSNTNPYLNQLAPLVPARQ